MDYYIDICRCVKKRFYPLPVGADPHTPCRENAAQLGPRLSSVSLARVRARHRAEQNVEEWSSPVGRAASAGGTLVTASRALVLNRQCRIIGDARYNDVQPGANRGLGRFKPERVAHHAVPSPPRCVRVDAVESDHDSGARV